MKIVTLTWNFLLLGFIWIMNINSGIKTENLMLVLGISALLIINIILIAGSKLYIGFKPENGRTEKSPFAWSPFLIIKIIATIVNLIVMVFIYISVKNSFRASGFLATAVNIIMTGTFLLSAIMIPTGKWSRFEGLRRTLILTGISLIIVVGGFFLTCRIFIGQQIKENIAIAKKEHPGKADDALLAYLSDSTKTARERTEIAVWTLGQIRSKKALPVLKSLYTNDSLSTAIKYNSAINYYDLNEAIISIESNWLGAREKNVFGSWTRLNK